MNIKNEKPVINDKELDAVNGGFMPIIYNAESRTPETKTVVLKPEHEKKTEKDKLIPIPY